MGNLINFSKKHSFNNPIKSTFTKNLSKGVSVFPYGDHIVRTAHKKREYNENLKVSCSSEAGLSKLIPLGNEVMESKPIASYLMVRPEFPELLPTAEWDNQPEERIEELKNGVNLDCDKVINLCIHYGNNNDYCDENDRSTVKTLKMKIAG
jgi:hypothetical protein